VAVEDSWRPEDEGRGGRPRPAQRPEASGYPPRRHEREPYDQNVYGRPGRPAPGRPGPVGWGGQGPTVPRSPSPGSPNPGSRTPRPDPRLSNPGPSGPAPRLVQSSRGSTQSRPYGRLQIFTLLDDKAADFDRLAEQTAEEVRIGEPDTLVYVIHLVPNAPMQRIFYEIYRDRAAFDSHENKSYIRRFVTERRAYVLATNVIELRLKYAKVAPLPAESRQLEAGSGSAARTQLPPGPRHGRA
jgi:quinol monooxygenase YgiN